MCKPYNEFKKTLNDYNEAIVNETNPIKKQELVTLKVAFLWENKTMYHIYKATQNIIEDDVNNISETIDNSEKDSMFIFCKDCPYYEPYNARFGLCKKLSMFSHREDYCAKDYIIGKKK